MTKSEKRKARKAGVLQDFTTPQAERHLLECRCEVCRPARRAATREQALETWARKYDALNGAPDRLTEQAREAWRHRP